jgi:hypothetical protein
LVHSTYHSPIEANLAKTKLDAYGVPCLLGDEHLASLYPLAYFAATRVRLHIFEDDRPRVDEILNESV